MLDHIHYQGGRLTIGGVGADELAARFGTPLYVYAGDAIRDRFAELSAAFAPLRPRVCYAVKACSNVHVCRLLAGLGAGMDVVSGGELARARLAGVAMSRVVFAGTGKTAAEIRDALTPAGSAAGSPCFNVESVQELERIAAIAGGLGVVAECALRVNPDVDAHTHRFTTTGRHENKFGVDIAEAPAIFAAWRDDRRIALRGLHCHLGSPIATPTPYVEALRGILGLIDRLAGEGVEIASLNLGGGFGVEYGNNSVAPIGAFAAAIVPSLAGRVVRGLAVTFEPGRWLVANAGVLLTTVQYVKRTPTKRFVICDAGVHTLIRPAFYCAHHFVWPAIVGPGDAPVGLAPPPGFVEGDRFDVVGPICESSDFLAQDRPLPGVAPDNLLAVFSAGAYGMSMASTYNDHPKPAEVMVAGGRATLIRRRQTHEELLAPELGTLGGS